MALLQTTLSPNNEAESPSRKSLEAGGRYPASLPLEKHKALIVTGSLMSNPYDRELTRDDVSPVQIIYDDVVRTAPFFQDFGALGISSFAFPISPSDPDTAFFSTGNDIVSVDVNHQSNTTHTIGNTLLDVHEINFKEDRLLIANTGRDEIVIYSTNESRVCSAIPLSRFRAHSHHPAPESTEQVLDHFHVNQAFSGIDGHIHALVHHVQGHLWEKFGVSANGSSIEPFRIRRC